MDRHVYRRKSRRAKPYLPMVAGLVATLGVFVVIPLTQKLSEIGNKTMTVTHLIVDETTGKPAATARALAIAMDLETRTSAAISAPRRARMLDLLIESPNH